MDNACVSDTLDTDDFEVFISVHADNATKAYRVFEAARDAAGETAAKMNMENGGNQ